MRKLRVLLVVLVVLLGLALAADRIGVAVAESKIADAFQQKYDLASTPDVSIDGFPFLTQVVAGRYGDVRVDANDVPTEEIGAVDVRLRAQGLELPLRNAVSGNVSEVPVERATATISAPLSALSERIGVDVYQNVRLSSLGGNKVRVNLTRKVSLAVIPIIADVDISASDGVVSFKILKFTVAGGGVPDFITDELSERLTFSFDVPPLIKQFDLTAVQVSTQNISLTGVARNIVLK